jgi:hypothetical protein
MHEVTMTKVTGGTAVRTAVTTGHCHKLPEVGKSFEMFSEPLIKDAGVRWITTSTIQKITPDEKCVIIETINSKYKLEFKET